MNSVRPRVDDDFVMRAAQRLTERDRHIWRMLADHGVFTTEQLSAMFFDNLTTARHRLGELHRLRLVDRFQPRRRLHDHAPYHYVLGELGTLVVGAEGRRTATTGPALAPSRSATGAGGRIGTRPSPPVSA